MTQNSKVERNFLKARKLIKLIAGHYPYIDTDVMYNVYKAYVVFLVSFQLFVSSLLIAAMYISYNNDDIFGMLRAMHMLVLTLASVGAVLARQLNNKTLLSVTEMQTNSVYSYDGEDRDDYDRITEEGEQNHESWIRLIRYFLYMGILPTYLVFIPAHQLMTMEIDDGPLDNFFATPIYVPFDRKTNFGYIAGIALFGLNILPTSFVVISMYESLAGIMSIIIVQLQILNHSLLNIGQRAKSKVPYGGSFPTNQKMAYDDKFNNILYSCLKANIEHHQAILRLLDYSSHYVGQIIIIFVSGGILNVAGSITFIIKNPEPFMMMLAVSIFGTEVLFHYTYCYYGEMVIQESGRLFISLYSTPWIKCDENFKQILLIMMSNTKNPRQIKAWGIDLAASMETFSSMWSTTYNITNIYRLKA